MACDFNAFKQNGGDIPTDVKMAQANVYYACKYFEAVDKQWATQAIIAGIQSAAQLYFADKQHEIAQQAQDRLDRITDEQLSLAGQQRAQFEYIIACERKMADDACDLSVAPIDYDAVKARIMAPIRAQFSRARQKLKQCYPVHCVSMALGEQRRLLVEEAKAIARALEGAYRREEALWETRKAAARAERLQALQVMRGYAQNASAALAGAAATTQAAAGINPYLGWQQAVNSIAGRASGLAAADAASYAMAMRGSYGGSGVAMPAMGQTAQTDGIGSTFWENYASNGQSYIDGLGGNAMDVNYSNEGRNYQQPITGDNGVGGGLSQDPYLGINGLD